MKKFDRCIFPSLKEPYRWPSVTAISKKVLGIRYSLLPYYYTLFYKAHRIVDSANSPAATVVRPLFFEFPKDAKTYSIDTQFLVGSGILISPQLNLGRDHTIPDCLAFSWLLHSLSAIGDQGKSLDVYFPEGKWYDWYTHQVASANGGETKTIDTPLDTILVCSLITVSSTTVSVFLGFFPLARIGDSCVFLTMQARYSYI